MDGGVPVSRVISVWTDIGSGTQWGVFCPTFAMCDSCVACRADGVGGREMRAA